MQDLTQYIARSVIRHLNGDFGEFDRLKDIALNIYEKEEQKRKYIATIGELVPVETKREIYKMLN